MKMRLNLKLVVILFFALPAWAKPSPPAKASAKPAPAAGDSAQHSFEDLLVQGKYHFSDEAVTTVEEDKVLDSLIGVRTDFKDRLEQSAERY